MRTTLNIGEVMKYRMMLSIVVAGLCTMMTVTATAGTAGTAPKRADKDNSGETIQRTPRGVFDQQQNVVSSIAFQTTNYGIFGFDVRNGVGGTFWPRGRRNQYIFAGGAWFGARKRPPGSQNLRKLVSITYNPNSGLSWMVPGTIEEGDEVLTSSDAINKYRTYFSTDFSQQDGLDFANPTFPRWPIWDTNPDDTIRYSNYYGLYVNEPASRVRTTYPKGPAFISEEDVFCVYKDTDLNYYEGGVTKRKADGYPLGMQIEQMVYSWGFGDYADFVFLKYMFIHPEKYKDTLFDCWMAAVQDVDIALATNPVGGAQNDRARFYQSDPSLNLAVQWTDGDRGEANQGFGYLGFNFLESPAVDAERYLRKDRRQFPLSEQLGMQRFRNWPIASDPIENEDRYNFISADVPPDGDLGAGDRRLMMATGPFNMRPGDSARIVIGIILATTAAGGDATGTDEDMVELIRKVRFAQFVYDNQFRAPKPPELSVIKGAPRGSTSGYNTFMTIPPEGFLPLNNAIAIQWDSTAELSIDTLERGLDFFGYRIYRARRTDQDTFAADFQLNARKGPLAWKQIAQYQMTSPFLKEGEPVGTTGVRMDAFEIADVIKPGQRRYMVELSPSAAEPWGSYYNRLFRSRDPRYALVVNQADSTIITSGIRPNTDGKVPFFDRLDSIRFTYYTTQVDTLPIVSRQRDRNGFLILDSVQAKAAKDTLVKLILARRVRKAPFLFRDTDTIVGTDGRDSVLTVFRPWEETNEVRRTLIANFMREQTRGRVFFDIGDDDRNGVVSYSSNPEASEKLINNIDYSYAVRAYDEGDFLLPTPQKLNNRAVGLPNVVTATPLAARPGNAVSFTFTTDEESRKKLGGIYNVRLLVQDPQRFNQLFAGRTLELEFFRFWSGYNPTANQSLPGDGLYGTFFVLRDSASREVLNAWSSLLPPELCPSANVPGLPGYFSENSAVYVDTNDVMYDTVYNQDGSINRVDTTTFGLPDSREKVIRSGTFTSDARCFTNKFAYGSIGVAFDYAIEQWGGIYRTDTAYITSGPPNIKVAKTNVTAGLYNNSDTLNPPPSYIDPPDGAQIQWSTSYNNGPGIYEVTFKEGGRENITSQFRREVGPDTTITFNNVPYLEYEIRNVYSFERQDPRPDGTVGTATVGYDMVLKPQVYLHYDSLPDVSKRTFPNAAPILLGNYTSAAFGWRNSRTNDFRIPALSRLAAESNSGRPLGQQNRYYVSRTLSTGGGDTLDFHNVIAFAGVQFSLDFTQLGRKAANIISVSGQPTPSNPVTEWAREDFKAGDKVRLLTFGGAFGFPFDSAKAYIRVAPYDAFSASTGGQSYTDEQLEQSTVVPNPYYVTHEGMSTPFQGQIYFTRLPRVCTITIYTVNGEIVKKIEHNELNGVAPDKHGADVWDLLSANNQRVASQMLIAKIETPEGASVIRKFSVVVGPARIVGDGE